jgi:AcrR family transcriptional regulator
LAVASTVQTEAPSRGARRKARTRARLLEAGRVLFAHQGVEPTTIAQIADEADVGFGSFYNHFGSKEEMVEVVLRETIEAQGAAVEALTRELTDPAEVVSVAHRHFVRVAQTDPIWAWLLIRLDASYRVVRAALGPYSLRDLRRGVKAGRFQVPRIDVALTAGGGALLAVMHSVLKGELGDGADVEHAEGVLRMFGLDADDAAEVARRPLPETRS